jgi:hypothetical protein
MNKAFAIPLAVLLGGCAAAPKNMPLLFGQSQTVGISIGGSASDQGAEFVLGYKDKNIALVPVTSGDDAKTPIHATINQANTHTSTDAMSVFGQFEVNARGSQRDVELGKFFATGVAAQELAAGFRSCLTYGNCKGTAATPAPTPPAAPATPAPN